MIRDPSDGSVKEAPVVNKSLTTPTRKKSLQVPVIETATSGLPLGSSKPENIAKLEKSREWLKAYHSGKLKQADEQEQHNGR